MKLLIFLALSAAAFAQQTPGVFRVRLQTTRGDIVLELHRDWAPHGVDRVYTLVRNKYYDDNRFFRVIKDRWVQFGVNGNPQVSKLWREAHIPDDPRKESNVRGTVAFAFAVPDGRTTQLFINTRDNSATHDKEPFVPLGKVIQGMDVVDALNSEYGETSGGGIRAGKQDAMFDQGNAWLDQHFPRLDSIRHAILVEP
jgi:peptidyl-prolyl cis-trans isomerase A (cyclophilin A)